MRLVLFGVVATTVLNGGSAKADFTFGEPTNLGPTVNSSANEKGPSISADGLTLYFRSARSGTQGPGDLWVTTRSSTHDKWGDPENLGATINSWGQDDEPDISADGLELYFYSQLGAASDADLWVARRDTNSDIWSQPVNLGSMVNSSQHDWDPSISADGLELYFNSDRPGGSGNSDLWVTTRATKEDPWSEPVNLGPTVNSLVNDASPEISDEGLMLFFVSARPGGYSDADIWVTTRATSEDDWGFPVNLGPKVNTTYAEFSPSISADGLWLYFCDYTSPRPGGHGGEDLWQAPIIPILDLNGDGIIDSADMCIMVYHWGENYSLCDIGPTPLGDGIVDVQDLIILSEHLFEEVNDPTLVAHWALDEAEGDVASDSVNDNDGTIYGGPAWQPEAGMVDGALHFDGIDDYVETDFVLSPADGPFSVLAWIKGDAPGQAVLSQADGSNWLCTDSVEGNLMTEIKAYGRGATGTLLSQTVITDGKWHRIGLVWDGSQRTLYVDDIAVAQDAQPDLEALQKGLYIGTGNAMEAGTYWSGLIDDVRIYNRAINP